MGIGNPIAAGVGVKVFICQHDSASLIKAKFKLRIDQNEPIPGCDLTSTCKNRQAFLRQLVPLLRGDQLGFQDFFLCDRGIMLPEGGLRGGRDNCRRKF